MPLPLAHLYSILLSLYLLARFSPSFFVLLLSMMDESRSKQAFTASQLQELELQALIFNYMALGIPIPSHLVLPFRQSFVLDPFSLHSSMSFGRRVEEDPEPWRCKRTDGKKWRCSREASGDSKYCERHKHRGKKCLNRTAEMPLFNISPSSSSLSSYAPPPLALYSHPVESKLSSLLGEATGLRLETPCHARTDMRTKEVDKQEHCYVFGADLKLQMPVNAASENKEAKSPKLQLNLFDDKSSHSWMNSREDNATQLSMSISRY